MEADSTIKILDFPFANGEIYTDEFALDETKAKQLADGNLYAVVKKNSAIDVLLKTTTALNTTVLDELFLPTETDTSLQLQALREAGYTEPQISIFGICLLKRPHGTVRYQDNELRRLEPVRGMQVWALLFGIPISTFTDNNGYYEIPWRFSFGTIMGTTAKNGRVNVKPLDTHGTLVREIYTLIAQFIVGSVHVDGWKTSCDMRNDIDFNFTGHTQVRYWSQILNAYYFHDRYATLDKIPTAPIGMTVYAQWGNINSVDNQNIPDFGGASTPMLGHIKFEGILIELFLNKLFDGNIDLALEFPTAFQLLTGLLPDMTFRVPQAQEPALYNTRFAEIAFHEISHASQYMQVGELWWANLIRAEIKDRHVFRNPYGDGNFTNAGHAALGESWAEFLGMTYQIRRYGANNAFNTCTHDQTYFDGTLGLFETIFFNEHYPSTQLIENQGYFYEGGDWIPMGFYYDLMDNTNIAPNNSAEDWDRIQGVTIRQMYNAFGPNITSTCDWLWNFEQQNPNIDPNEMMNIAQHHNFPCF